MNISVIKFNNQQFQNKLVKINTDSKSIQSMNPNFGAYYGLRGTPSELNQIINNMKKTGKKFRFFELSSGGSKKMIGVITEDTIAPANKKIKFKNPIEAEDILDSTKLIYFDHFTSVRREVKKFQKNGLEFIGNVSTHNDGVLLNLMTNINAVNLPTSMVLKETIRKLSIIGNSVDYKGDVFNFPDLNLFSLFSNEKLIEKCEKLADSKIQGLKGCGQYSMAFLTDSNKIFKASRSPNTPEVLKNYDIPVFSRKQIGMHDDNKLKKLYCVMQKNAKSWVEEKITPADEEKLYNKIIQNGDSPWDYYHEQIAKIDGEPYLIDAQSAKRDNPLWGMDTYLKSLG